MLDNFLTKSLSEAIETVIPEIPKKCQAEARENVQRLKDNPETLLAALDEIIENDEPETDEPTVPIDYESASYKSFAKTCADSKEYFEKNQKLIAETYKEEFAKARIKLIVNW